MDKQNQTGRQRDGVKLNRKRGWKMQTTWNRKSPTLLNLGSVF